MQKAGGTFTLTADVDFGATYGLKSVYYKSRNTPSTAGIVRLGNNESVGWRNAANSANLELKANASNLLEYNGSLIGILAAALTPSRALVSDGSGNVSVSSVTSTQLAYLASATGTTGTTSTNLVFSTSPTFITPTLGAASATSINKVAITAPATGSTLTIADGKTVTLSKTMTVTSADDTSTLTLAAGAQTVGGSGAADITTNSGTQNLLNKTVVSSTSATTGALNIPTGTVAQRPTAATGMIRHNSDTGEFEGYSNAAWQSIGGGVNERAIKNYYKAYAQSTIAPGTLSTVASTGNITVSGSGLSVTSAFYADVTSGASALTQDTSSAIRGTNSYLSALSSANTNGSVYFQFPAFVLDPVDLGKPVSVSFDLTSSIADGDYDVCVVRYNSSGTYQEVISVAGSASSSSVTPSAKLPTGTTSFQGFFIAGSTSTDVYALRIRRLVGSATIKLDSLYVGPQSVVQGAAVTDWQSFTPSWAGVVNITSQAWEWRRVGKNMEIQGHVKLSGAVTTTIAMTLPNSETIDTTHLITSTNTNHLGSASYLDSGTTNGVGAVVYGSSTTIQLTGGSSSNWAAASPITWAANDQIAFTASIPIVGWSSNVTMANRACEEYLYNTGTTATAGGSNSAATTAYGVGGTSILSIASTTANSTTYFDITLPSTAQQTDLWKLEITNGFGSWIDAPPYITQGTSKYGMLAELSSATNMRVYFGNKGARPTNATYAGDGEAWSGYSGYKWRVRKIGSGASVGYPVSTANIVGRTDGTTVGSVYIGEKITGTINSSGTMTTGNIYDMGTISLTPGVWMLYGYVISGTSGTPGAGSYIDCGISATSATLSSLSMTRNPILSVSGNDARVNVPPAYVNVSANTTYYLVAGTIHTTSTQTRGASTFNAVRIA